MIEKFGKAVVFEGPGKPLRVRTFPLPRLGPGEILVEILMCTLCGSDVHTHEGRRGTPCPTVLGHEILGRVLDWGPGNPPHSLNAGPLNRGDRITWSLAGSCGDCFFCRHGLPQKCTHLFKYGHERLRKDWIFSGGLAEYCHLRKGTAVLKVCEDLPDEVACPVNCATATVAAALRAAGDLAEKAVLVQGAGMLGQTASAMLSRSGAARVAVTDIDPERLRTVLDFGATDTFAVTDGKPSPFAEIREFTEGRGADVVLDFTGEPEALELGLECLRVGGRFIWVGAVYPARPIRLDAEKVVRNLLTLVGVYNYTPHDLQTALEFLTEDSAGFPFARLVSCPFPLEQASLAFECARKGGSFRVAVRPRLADHSGLEGQHRSTG